MLLIWHLPLASARRWLQALRDAYAVERRLLKIMVLDAELAVSCSQLQSRSGVVEPAPWLLGLDIIHRLVAVDDVLALRLCLVLVVDHAKRGGTGVAWSAEGHRHSCLQVHLRLADVVELVALLLGKLER